MLGGSGGRWIAWGVFVVAALASAGCSCSDSESEPTTTRQGLCPTAPPDALELCVSFDALTPAGGPVDVGNGLNVAVEGDVQFVEGRSGKAVQFGANGGRIVVDGFSIDDNQLTFGAWVKAEGPQNGYASVIDYWAVDKGLWLGSSFPGTGWEAWNGLDVAGYDAGIVAGEWQHIAGVYDGPPVGAAVGGSATLRLYINAEELALSEALEAFVKPDLGALYIGSKGDNSDSFVGVIDEVMVWSEVRTREQICTDAGGTWTGSSCSYNPPPAAPPNPCDGVTCSGHGSCSVQAGAPTCQCDTGYTAEGSECVTDPGPCAGIDALLQNWLDYVTSELPSGVDTQAQDFVSTYTPGNSAWTPQAEAWTVLGVAGTWQNALEPACLGFVRAALLEPDNTVALNNAASCMYFYDYGEDGRQLADCAVLQDPTNASAKASQAYHEYTYNADIAKAIELYEEAATLDPTNPEWSYQAMQLALESGDTAKANQHLAALPPPSSSNPGGYKGSKPPATPQDEGGHCCPCGTPTMYMTSGECTANCSASLSCFTGICAFTGTCEAPANPFAFGLKLCIPPSGFQICFTIDTNGTIGVQLGISVLNGFLGVGAGFQYNTINKNTNFVVDVGTNKLPINAGTNWTVDLSSGKVEGAVGLNSSSNAFTSQVTVVSKP